MTVFSSVGCGKKKVSKQWKIRRKCFMFLKSEKCKHIFTYICDI